MFNLINNTLQSIFWFIIVVLVVVVIHEFGHFIVARMNGVKVEKFAIGFGPKLLSYIDKYGTEWRINCLWLGGYVQIYGQENSNDIKDKSVAFCYKKLWQRSAIVLAGPMMNYILSFILIFGLSFMLGIDYILPEIIKIRDNSPAQIAGLEPGDIIAKVNNTAIDNFNQIKLALQQIQPGDKVYFNIIRNNINLSIDIVPQWQGKIPTIGIEGGKIGHKNVDFIHALQISCNFLITGSTLIIKTLFELISGHGNLDEMGGPIKIAYISSKSAEQGIAVFLMFIAILSVNLAVMNLLPLPILDGGHLFNYFIEFILGKPLPQRFQIIAVKISFIILLSLTIFVTWNDILAFFNK